MPSKKKKYNARFPAGRIKKIMQSDEEIGKVAQAVPVIISRTLELFVDSLLTKTLTITNSRNAKTLSTSHMKQCIMSEQSFDFLRELVKNIPDISVAEEAANYNEEEAQSSPEEQYVDSDTPYDLSMPSTSTQASRNGGGTADYYKRSHSHNGGGGSNTRGSSMRAAQLSAQLDEPSRAHLKRESDIMQRLQPRVGVRSAVAGSSVIMHTTTALANVGSESLPAKFSRSESTPANAHNWQPSSTQTSRQRLKHQPHSLPYAAATSSQPHHLVKQRILSKQQQSQEGPMPQTAIPAPIVSFDFCNKPVVKIDYSNLPMIAGAAATSVAAPLSAPANIAAAQAVTRSAFDFSAEPVISIDLSNIVANAAAKPENTTASVPAVATISIGAIPEPMAIPSSAHPIIHSNPSPNPKATMAAPLNHNSSATPSKNSFFELDEDYDNI